MDWQKQVIGAGAKIQVRMMTVPSIGCPSGSRWIDLKPLTLTGGCEAVFGKLGGGSQANLELALKSVG